MRIIVLLDRYNCDDVHCYFDLSRLRGLRYMTWQNLNKLTQEDEASYTATNYFHINTVYVRILCYQATVLLYSQIFCLLQLNTVLRLLLFNFNLIFNFNLFILNLIFSFNLITAPVYSSYHIDTIF